MIIGLTGGIGSGKTTVAKLFKKFNDVAIYIADVEAKEMMHSSAIIRSKIIENFGAKAYKDKLLDRAFLAKEVFSNKEKLSVLNKIVHPEVRKHFKTFVSKNKDKTFIIYEAAILFESGNASFCDVIISVHVNLEERIKRVLKRDQITKKEVLERIQNQWKEGKKQLLSNYIINNNSLDQTTNQVNNIYNILVKKSS